MSRKLILKRIDICEGQFALHDAETGEVLAAQISTTIISKPRNLVQVVVVFETLPGAENGLAIISTE